MMTPPSEHLESQLRELTTWNEPAPELWKIALSASQRDTASCRLRNGPAPRLRPWLPLLTLGGIAAMALLMLKFSGVVESRKVNDAAKYTRSLDSSAYMASDPSAYMDDFTDALRTSATPASSIPADASPTSNRPADEALSRTWPARVAQDAKMDSGAVSGGAPAAPDAAEPRRVVRKATMELLSRDVRGAFLKVGMLISAARGEFIEQSSLTGNSGNERGIVKLRVCADRLDAVLGALRELATVEAEKLDGEDVTSQALDLDARLRNERRVEQEILTLLDRRSDAPLEDVLKLREHLGQMRLTIERLEGQRDRLARLVSLAAVLVIIRPDQAAPVPATKFSDHVTGAMDRAWRAGLRTLADSIAWLIQTAVGGLLVWIVLIAVALFLRAAWRRSAGSEAYRQ